MQKKGLLQEINISNVVFRIPYTVMSRSPHDGLNNFRLFQVVTLDLILAERIFVIG